MIYSGGLFNCQRWMASIGVLSLLMNQAICHFKQIYPHAVVQAHSQERTPGSSSVCLETGLKMKEKQVSRGKVLSRDVEHIAAYISPTLLPFSLFDIFMQIWAGWFGSMERINGSLSPWTRCNTVAEDCGSERWDPWARRASAAILQVWRLGESCVWSHTWMQTTLSLYLWICSVFIYPLIIN